MQYQKPRIVFINCYFGKLPWYFSYFLHSCKYNPDVDFIIITDGYTSEYDLSHNIKIINKTLPEVNDIINDRLNTAIRLTDPYKLCDFKPTYGHVFPELIEGYSFWGHCDIDIIWGNVKNFINDEMLDRYDVISSRHDYVSAWFTLYRNAENINRLFMQSKDYKKVLSDTKYYNFDETNFRFKQFSDGVSHHNINCEVQSMTHLVKELDQQGIIKAYFDTHAIEGLTGRMKWDKGTLIYKNKYEVMLYHLLAFKKVFNPKNQNRSAPDHFSISTNKIYFR